MSQQHLHEHYCTDCGRMYLCSLEDTNGHSSKKKFVKYFNCIPCQHEEVCEAYYTDECNEPTYHRGKLKVRNGRVYVEKNLLYSCFQCGETKEIKRIDINTVEKVVCTKCGSLVFHLLTEQNNISPKQTYSIDLGNGRKAKHRSDQAKKDGIQ